jgi:4-aminobutyrate aminotransferase
MNAVEFNVPGSKTPDSEFAAKVRESALDKGLILLTCGVYGNVIRFLAPITIENEVFGEALDILEDTLRKCAAGA